MDYISLINIFFMSLVIVNGKVSEKTTAKNDEMKPEQRLAELLKELLEVLSDGDKGKKKFLTSPYSRFSSPNATDCYFNAFGAFMTHCCNFFYELGSTRKFKYLFHRACEADWLTEKTVIHKVRTTCESKPHLRSEYTTTPKFRMKEPTDDDDDSDGDSEENPDE